MKFEKEIYYHFRNEKNEPVITICLLKEGKNYYRGMSICSLKETPLKIKGRTKAKGRAEKATVYQTTSEPIVRDEVIEVFDTLKSDYKNDKYIGDKLTFMGYKSVSNAILTDFEERLLSNKENRK